MITEPAYESQEAIDCSYVARGRYAEQLERWLQRFPREQLLVLTSDELLADPGGSTDKVARFLDVPAWRASSYPLRGVRDYVTMAPETRERLTRAFSPENERLERLLGHALPWTRQRD
jgi:hypothetical protein